MDKNNRRYGVDDLLRVMQRLRDPIHGCPWDLQQDFRSIVPSTLEEAYELAAAIEEGDFDHVEDELGDLLFQVIFYSQLGSEQGLFEFESVVSTLVRKLLRRHPHVFAHGSIEGVVNAQSSVEDVKESWEAIKARERQTRELRGILADIPTALPALSRAQKLQKRAAKIHFDWQDVDGVFAKLEEEMLELRAAISNTNEEQIYEEMGDVLFTCVNLSRHLKVDAESGLRSASQKFASRIARMEAISIARGQLLENLDEAAMDELWQAAKAVESEAWQDL